MKNHDVSSESTSRKRLVQINEKTANAAEDTKKALIWIRPRKKQHAHAMMSLMGEQITQDVRVSMTARRG